MQVFLETVGIFGIRGMRDVDKQKTSQSGFKQFLKYCTSGRVTEQKFNYNTGKFSKVDA